MNDKTKRPKAVSDQNISYYNQIASNYDEILDKDAANALARKKVSAFFTNSVSGKRVLDFGGGTGQDLGWLMENNYEILFCEPSVSMRNVAIERSKHQLTGADIRFLHERECDFRSWPGTFPDTQKMDAILANFAVINCIPDIRLLFENFAKLMGSGALVVALVLENGLKKRLAASLKGAVTALFSQKPVTITINYQGRQQIVYIHSMRGIKRAMGKEFSFFYHEQLQACGFRLICLRRK
jgi:ubiquinone/menaquinone biosynthesis C-methylase UbiE